LFWTKVLIAAAAGYLLGNLNGALLISRWVYKSDIRNSGSGNAGLTNYFRTYGGLRTLIVLAIDVAKTVAACMLGGALLRGLGLYEFGKMLGGAFTVLGHMFPVFFHFRGGKGILCCAAIAGAMDWWAFAVILGTFILVLVLTKYVSLGSCMGAVVFAPSLAWRFPGNTPVIVMALLLSLMAIYMHRENIGRLIHGTESKFTFHKKN